MLAFSRTGGVELVSGLSGFESAWEFQGGDSGGACFFVAHHSVSPLCMTWGCQLYLAQFLHPFGLVAKHVLQEGCLGGF